MPERIRNIGKEYMSTPLKPEEYPSAKDIEAGKQASKGKERKGLKKLITTGLGILATLAAIQSGARRAEAKGTETNVKGGVITESGEVPEWDAPISFDQELTIKTENKEQQRETLEVSTLPQFAISDYEKARLKDNQGFTPDLDSPLGKNAKRLEALELPKDAVGIYTAFSPDMQNATNFLYFKGEVLIRDKDGRQEKFPKGAIMYLDMQGGLHYLVPGEGKKAIISIVDENLQNFFGSLSFKDGRKITVPNLGEFILLEVNGNGVITLFITNHEPINVSNPESSGLQGTPTPPATEEAPKAQDINVGAREKLPSDLPADILAEIDEVTPDVIKNDPNVNLPNKETMGYWRTREDGRVEVWNTGMSIYNLKPERGWLIVGDTLTSKDGKTKIILEYRPEGERTIGNWYKEMKFNEYAKKNVMTWLEKNLKELKGKTIRIQWVEDYDHSLSNRDFVETWIVWGSSGVGYAFGYTQVGDELRIRVHTPGNPYKEGKDEKEEVFLDNERMSIALGYSLIRANGDTLAVNDANAPSTKKIKALVANKAVVFDLSGRVEPKK